MEDSFRREELKGQRHQQKDDGIDGAFALWVTNQIALRWGAIIIIRSVCE